MLKLKKTPVDGWFIMVYPIIYRVSSIQGGVNNWRMVTPAQVLRLRPSLPQTRSALGALVTALVPCWSRAMQLLLEALVVGHGKIMEK